MTSKTSRRVLVALLGLCALLVVAAVFVPVLDGPNMHQHANEAAAAGTLRRINTLQKSYIASHPSNGFTCELLKLRAEEPAKNSDDYEYAFLSNESYAGYIFTLTECKVDSNRRAVSYKITAVPREPGKSGFRTFCTDESGQLWEEQSGSGVKCFSSGHLLD